MCSHGIVHGFTLLERAESETQMFEMFFTRFPQGNLFPVHCRNDIAAPGVIVYDRACRLHVYVLKREPWFFRNTVFRVDITHYKGVRLPVWLSDFVHRAHRVQRRVQSNGLPRW
jgi:hypothetical protein